MNKHIIDKAQEYLTVLKDDGDRVYQIVNIELLLKKHPSQAVISFLQELRKENKKELRKLLSQNVTDHRINDLVAKNFRLKMAINTIRNHIKHEKEKMVA